MKKTIIPTLALMLIGIFAQAQTESKELKQTLYLSKQLNITDSLTTQVETIMANYKTNAAKVMENKKFTPEEMRTKIEALIEDKNNKLKKILSEDQLQKFLPTSEKKKE